jgi:hypothetical protein
MSTDTIKLLVTSDIHYGQDYTYTAQLRALAGTKCTVRGSWGNTVMPMVMKRFHQGQFDLLLDGGDKFSDNKAVYESGRLGHWHYELHTHFAQAGYDRFLDVKGNHCGGVAKHMGYPYKPESADFPSSYRDVKGFRIVLSNVGTSQLPSKGRGIPQKHLDWLEDVVGNSPYPVIFLQHVPPDEFDNGQDYYARLAAMDMVALAIHGHRHEPATLEFAHGIPVLHMQALLYEDQPGMPGAYIAEIEIDPDHIRVTTRALLGACGTDRLYTIDRKDLSLAAGPVATGCAHAPEPAAG